MKENGTIYTCDECGKKCVDAEWEPKTPQGWISTQNYTSHDRLSLLIDDVPVQVVLKEKDFCSMPCLTFHIGSIVADAVEKAKAANAPAEGEESAA